MGYDWNFRLFTPFIPALARGTLITFELSILASILGTILGVPLGLALRLPWLGPGLRLVNDMFRAIPILVLMFFFYYFPYSRTFHIPPLGPFATSAIALTLAQTSFTGEVVRAAIDGVSIRLINAGRALGLKEGAVWRYIVLPDVVRQILPTLVAFHIGNVKLSSLASVIGCEELVFNARLAVGLTFHSLEAWVIVAGVYVILIVPFTIGARYLEQSTWLRRRA
jgi:polar amino acid transport system permease protein